MKITFFDSTQLQRDTREILLKSDFCFTLTTLSQDFLQKEGIKSIIIDELPLSSEIEFINNKIRSLYGDFFKRIEAYLTREEINLINGSKWRIVNVLAEAYYLFDRITKFLNTKNVASIYYIGNNDLIKEILSFISNDRNIVLKIKKAKLRKHPVLFFKNILKKVFIILKLFLKRNNKGEINKDIFFIPYTRNHLLTMSLPVKLLKSNQWGTLIPDITFTKKKNKADFNEFGIKNIIQLSGFNSIKNIVSIVKKAQLFKKIKYKFQKIQANSLFDEIIHDALYYSDETYQGLSYRNTFISDTSKFKYLLNQAYLFVLLKSCFSKLNPKKIVIMNEVTEIGRIAALVSQELKIKSYYLPHASISNHPAYSEIPTDFMFVSGDRDLNKMIEYGASKEKMVLTGQPRYDFIINMKYKTKEELCKDLNLDPNKKIIMYASNPISTIEVQTVCQGLVLWMEKNKDIQLLIKPHPAQTEEEIVQIMDGLGFTHYVIKKKCDLYEVLKHVDGVVVTDSTVGLEAMYYSKPVINGNFTNRTHTLPYVEMGVALPARNIVELGENLTKLLDLNHPDIKELLNKQKDFLFQFTYKNDGKATNRVVKFLTKGIKEA